MNIDVGQIRGTFFNFFVVKNLLFLYLLDAVQTSTSVNLNPEQNWKQKLNLFQSVKYISKPPDT